MGLSATSKVADFSSFELLQVQKLFEDMQSYGLQPDDLSVKAVPWAEKIQVASFAEGFANLK